MKWRRFWNLSRRMLQNYLSTSHRLLIFQLARFSLLLKNLSISLLWLFAINCSKKNKDYILLDKKSAKIKNKSSLLREIASCTFQDERLLDLLFETWISIDSRVFCQRYICEDNRWFLRQESFPKIDHLILREENSPLHRNWIESRNLFLKLLSTKGAKMISEVMATLWNKE